MNHEGIDVTEAETAFSLSELGLSRSKVDALENATIDVLTSEEEELNSDDEDDDDSLVDSDEEYAKLLDSQMDKLYDDYLTRRGDSVKTRKAIKRSKIAKRALAGEAVAKDAELYDGDTKEYHKMINPEAVSS
jgi:AdoMet-dependent rRNA methyltransferase SPB1